METRALRVTFRTRPWRTAPAVTSAFGMKRFFEPAEAAASAARMEVTSLTPREFLLKRPDTYIGSVNREKVSRVLVLDAATNRMVLRDVCITPAFIGIIDELLVNACDVHHREREEHATRGEKMRTLRVDIDVAANRIRVENDGRVLPIIQNEQGLWQPEIAFGVFNSSSAYDDGEKRFRGGRNGIGAKGTNGMSTEFTVHIVDHGTKRTFRKTWRNNMGDATAAEIRPAAASEKNKTSIECVPDLARFGMTRIDEDAMGVLARRVIDCAGLLKNVSVFLNGAKIHCSSFRDYCDICMGARSPFEEGAAAAESSVIAYAKTDEWEVAVASCGLNEGWQLSFVNGIWTRRGGNHVDAIVDQISAHAKSNHKITNLTNSFILRNCRLFIHSLVVNPEFDSQRKEELKTPHARLGAFPALKNAFLSSVMNKTMLTTAIEQRMESAIKTTLSSASSSGRTIHERQKALLAYEKLRDAPLAMTAKRKLCKLILTEGDSARTTAINGLSALSKEDQAYYGVFPLKGKVLNVTSATETALASNDEIVAITKILGLDLSKRGEEATSKLRYGQVILMTDQDHDGAHIKGLVINALTKIWPSLTCGSDAFVSEFITPVAQASRGKECRSFYSAKEYDEWKRGPTDGWDVKFFKGLATSTPVQAKSYFSNLDFHLRAMDMTDKTQVMSSLDLAFNPKRSEDRKRWILTVSDRKDDSVEEPAPRKRIRNFKEFMDTDLLAYSDASTRRAIPSCMDGLKPTQRKVIATFLDGFCAEGKKGGHKVADLVGIVNSSMKYHHGEKSMADTICRMAQRFWCSNTLPYLRDIGSFGSRLQGGDADCGSPRYIFTTTCVYTKALFPKEDMDILERMTDDGNVVEPVFLAPVIPTVLLNGAEGIGTGWSTYIPPFAAEPLIAHMKNVLRRIQMPAGADHPPLEPLVPHFPLFKGRIWIDRDGTKQTLRTRGVLRVEEGGKKVVITELPACVWTDEYKKLLTRLADEETVRMTLPLKRFAEEMLEKGVTEFPRPYAIKSLNPLFRYAVSRDKDKSAKVTRLPFLAIPLGDACDAEHVEYHLELEEAVTLADYDALIAIFELENSFSMSNMHLFNPSGAITLYESAEKIIEDYVPVRLLMYDKRLARELQLARAAAKQNSDKARFIQAVCDGAIQVLRRKKEEIVGGILALGIEPTPSDPTFEYLRKLPLTCFSKEGAEEYEAEAEQSRQSVLALESMTPVQLWLSDLERLERLIEKEREHDRAMVEMEAGMVRSAKSKLPRPTARAKK